MAEINFHVENSEELAEMARNVFNSGIFNNFAKNSFVSKYYDISREYYLSSLEDSDSKTIIHDIIEVLICCTFVGDFGTTPVLYSNGQSHDEKVWKPLRELFDKYPQIMTFTMTNICSAEGHQNREGNCSCVSRQLILSYDPKNFELEEAAYGDPFLTALVRLQ